MSNASDTGNASLVSIGCAAWHSRARNLFFPERLRPPAPYPTQPNSRDLNAENPSPHKNCFFSLYA
jgi:hypothetical protein